MRFRDEAAKSTTAKYEAIIVRFIVTQILDYLPENRRLLDLGSGSGRDAAFFLEQGYDVTGLDAEGNDTTGRSFTRLDAPTWGRYQRACWPGWKSQYRGRVPGVRSAAQADTGLPFLGDGPQL